MNRASSDAAPSQPTTLHPLLASGTEETPADRLLLGLEQARMAVRLGLEPDRVVLGRFVLERLVGRGGMGVVFAACDPTLERTVALKVLTLDSERARVVAVAEARALARLVHPNIVTVFEAGFDGELAYVAMAFIHGQTLREWLRARPRDVTELLPLFVAAGRGLAAAHAEGLLHRDFKPDNVLVGADGRVRVVDFGLARDLDDASDAGSCAGTPAYMAPERTRGEPASAAADQFSFCMAVWEACCGVRPYTLEGLRQLALGEIEAPQVPEGVQLDGGLVEVLQIGLTRDPQLRWPDMDALVDALQRLSPGPSARVQSAARAQAIGLDPWTAARLERERRRRIELGLASAALVIASAFTGWWIAEVPEPSREPEPFTPEQRAVAMRVGGLPVHSESIAHAATFSAQMQLLDTVFGRGVTLAWVDSSVLAQIGDGDPIATRAAGRRWLVQICLHAYISVGEARYEAAEVLARCRFAVGDIHGAPTTAIARAVWHDELARFTNVFALTLRDRYFENAELQQVHAEMRQCHAEVDWQRHLAGHKPSHRIKHPVECAIEYLQSGPQPDTCQFYDVVRPPWVLMSEPMSMDMSDG